MIKYTEKDESYSAKGDGAALIVEDIPQFKTTARLANVSVTSVEVTLEKSRDRTFLKVHSKLVHLVKVLLAIKQSECCVRCSKCQRCQLTPLPSLQAIPRTDRHSS